MFYIYSSGGLKLLNICLEELITRSRIIGELVFKSTPNNSNVTWIASNSRMPCATFGCRGWWNAFKPPPPPPPPVLPRLLPVLLQPSPTTIIQHTTTTTTLTTVLRCTVGTWCWVQQLWTTTSVVHKVTLQKTVALVHHLIRLGLRFHLCRSWLRITTIMLRLLTVTITITLILITTHKYKINSAFWIASQAHPGCSLSSWISNPWNQTPRGFRVMGTHTTVSGTLKTCYCSNNSLTTCETLVGGVTGTLQKGKKKNRRGYYRR